MLVILVLLQLAVITAMTVIFCVKGFVPDTLIQYTLGPEENASNLDAEKREDA